MAGNLLSRFLPQGASEPSIYQLLREPDDTEETDVEERAGMTALPTAPPSFIDEEDETLDQGEGPSTAEPQLAGLSGENGAKTYAEGTRDRIHKGKARTQPSEYADDEVPQSLLIEDKEGVIPTLQTQQQRSSYAPSDRSATRPEVQSNLYAAREQQRLHQDVVPPRIRTGFQSRSQGTGSLTDQKERALWMWSNVSNLDNFLMDVYDYYIGNGIWSITLHRILNLLTLAFVVGFSTFLLSCIDFKSIPRSKSLGDIVIPKCTRQWSTSTNLFLWVFTLFWIYKFFEALYDLQRLRRLQLFFKFLLNVPESDIQTVGWQDIVKKLMDLRDLNPSTAANLKPVVQRFIGSQSKQRMDAHDIANRLMRRDNYLIALVNKDLLDLTLPIPFLRNRQLFSRTLQWNLSMCILDHVFDERGQVRPLFLKDTHRRSLSEALRRRFRFAGFMNALCAPFIVLFFVVYYFFRYFNEYQRNPSQIGSRQYTPLAEWKFREFNELWHFFERRINMSYPFASRYLDQFPKDKTVQLSSFLAFVAGAMASVLAVASLIDPESFLAFEITHDRTVLFYLGVFGTIWAVARGVVPSENIVFDPEFALRDVITYTRYMPSHWSGRLHTNEVRAEFASLYKMKVLIFLEELMSILLTPFVLWFSLPQCSDKIVDFVREFTLHVDGLGYVCSFAVFDFKKGVNQPTQAPDPSNQKLREEYYSTKDGKMLASYYGFIDNYVTSQRPGAPFMHPEGRHSFQAPPAFPGMMASNWLGDAHGPARVPKSERVSKAMDRSTNGGPLSGMRSTYRRNAKLQTTAEHSLPMDSVLLDPQHQPANLRGHSQSRSSAPLRTYTSGLSMQDHDEAEEEALDPPSHSEGLEDTKSAEDLLGESWETTQAGNRKGDDGGEGLSTAPSDGMPGVLELVYQFSRAQADGRGAGVNI